MTPDEHARRAEDLIAEARSTRRPGRRRDLLAEALVHATLATRPTQRVDQPAGAPSSQPGYRHPAVLMPAPKGYECPACQHSVIEHRDHGCDRGGCDCPAPHGRIMPADPEPTGQERGRG